MEFNYKIKNATNYNHVTLSGNLLEKNEADLLLETLNGMLYENKLFFVFDLENMNFINSTGLNILINMLTKIRNCGGDMAIYNVPRKINQVLLITKLNSIFNVSQTLGEAERNIANSIKQHQTTN